MTALEKLQKFGMSLNLTIRCLFPDIEGNWMVSFESVEIKEDAILTSNCGRAKTVEVAAAEYLDAINGKRLIAHAMNETLRREVSILF